MKQCNTADQLIHCLVSYCGCHSAIASCLLAMAVFSTGYVLEYHIYRDYDTELSEFPDDQQVISSHYAKIKDTELCDVHFIQCTSLCSMYVMPLECTCSTRKLAAIRACF